MIGLAALAGGAALGALAVASSSPPVSTADRAAIERIVHDYILAHPEILPEAMTKLQERETGTAVATRRAQIETPFANAWEGAAKPDVTLVEFFDYSCGYCRASVPVVERLLKEDPRLRVVYRELPVLGPDSEAAAGLSLVAAKTRRYGEFHRALYGAVRPDARARERLASQFSLDAKTAGSSDIQSEIAGNLQLQRDLGMTGTPSWVVGDKVLIGAVGYDALKAAIAEARAK